jgi:hypothetical protein
MAGIFQSLAGVQVSENLAGVEVFSASINYRPVFHMHLRSKGKASFEFFWYAQV